MPEDIREALIKAFRRAAGSTEEEFGVRWAAIELAKLYIASPSEVDMFAYALEREANPERFD